MSEQKIPIPAMLYNAAVGGHVTSSQQIIDENLNREQNDINQETVGAVPYNSTTPNGMGRIVLKKADNFKSVVEAQTNGNTIFVIKYDFTLTDDVTVPTNCVLQFDGGSISGNSHSITFSSMESTSIIAPSNSVVFKNVTFTQSTVDGNGYFHLSGEGNPIWFGAEPDTGRDCTKAIQDCLNLYKTCVLPRGEYTVSSPIIIWLGHILKGLGNATSALIKSTNIKASSDFVGDYIIKSRRRNNDEYYINTWDTAFSIINISFDCNYKVPALGLQLCNNIHIEECLFKNNNKYIDVLHETYLLLFKDCIFIGNNTVDKVIEFSLGTNEPQDFGFDVTFERCITDASHDGVFCTVNKCTTGIFRFNNCSFEDIPTIIHLKRDGTSYRSEIIEVSNTNLFPVNAQFGDKYIIELETIESSEVADPYISFRGCAMPADKVIRYKRYNGTTITYGLPVATNNNNMTDCYFIKGELISSVLFPVTPSFEYLGNNDRLPIVIGRNDRNKISSFIKGTNGTKTLDAFGKTMILDVSYGAFPSAQDLNGLDDSNIICTRVIDDKIVTAIWNYDKWINIATGYDVRLGYGGGATTERPSSPFEGLQYYDTTLKKPIWWNGTNWVDATGATV